MAHHPLLDQARRSLTWAHDRKRENVEAVFDDDLWRILRDLELLEPLDRGELRCHLTGTPLTRDNIGGLIGTPTGPKLIADTYAEGGPE